MRAMLVWVLVALWVPLTSHCLLETAGVIPMDECCSPSAQAPPDAHGQCTDGCRSFEEGLYKVQDNLDCCLGAPPVGRVTVKALEPSPGQFQAVDSIVFWPPATLHLAEFLITTSLPIRGPSLVS